VGVCAGVYVCACVFVSLLSQPRVRCLGRVTSTAGVHACWSASASASASASTSASASASTSVCACAVCVCVVFMRMCAYI